MKSVQDHDGRADASHCLQRLSFQWMGCAVSIRCWFWLVFVHVRYHWTHWLSVLRARVSLSMAVNGLPWINSQLIHFASACPQVVYTLCCIVWAAAHYLLHSIWRVKSAQFQILESCVYCQQLSLLGDGKRKVVVETSCDGSSFRLFCGECLVQELLSLQTFHNRVKEKGWHEKLQ